MLQVVIVRTVYYGIVDLARVEGRRRVPRGVKLMPHRHPEDRVYTVISGVFYIGLGDRFDPEKLQALSRAGEHDQLVR